LFFFETTIPRQGFPPYEFAGMDHAARHSGPLLFKGQAPGGADVTQMRVPCRCRAESEIRVCEGVDAYADAVVSGQSHQGGVAVLAADLGQVLGRRHRLARQHWSTAKGVEHQLIAAELLQGSTKILADARPEE